MLIPPFHANSHASTPAGDDKYNSKYFKGQSKESKESRRARNKAAKRTKFDPEKVETTRDVKERLAREAEEEDGDDQEEEVVLSKKVAKKKSEKKHDKKKEAAVKTADAVAPTATDSTLTTEDPTTLETSYTSRIEALRAKLHAKLEEQRSKRPTDPNAVSKRAARRAVKQQRTEEAKKRRAMTKVGQGEKTKQYTVATNSASTSSDLANLDFGKLAGLNPTPKNFANNKSLANVNKKKNLQKMLADAEEKKQKLEELKRSNDEGDKVKHQKLVWSDALKEASGERIKDDPNKLRKALKHKIAKKEKSAKAWKSRMETTKQKVDERQKIRNHNLEKRKAGGSVGANLSSKKIATEEKVGEDGKTPSRRLSRAGFEGKKQGFLNQGTSAKKGDKKMDKKGKSQ
jgi:Surfeit locus protein 6